MSVKAAAEAIEAGLNAAKTAGGWGVSRDPGAPGPLPAVVIGPPSLDWGGMAGMPPTEATFPIYVVVDPGERAVEQLWELVPAVAAVLDEVVDVVSRTAQPTDFPIGAEDFPAYQILAEVSLQ